MASPGASGREPQEKLEINLWGSGAGDIEDQKPTTPQLKKRYYQHVRVFGPLQKLVQKYSSYWYDDYLCYIGCSNGESTLHIMQLTVHEVSG